MTDSHISAFVERMAEAAAGPGRTNFLDDAVPENAQRRRNLEIYLQEMLDREPAVLLLGEAPGYRGMRITGVPFTNRTMFEGPANSFGLFGPGKGYRLPADAAGVAAEPTATVMWDVLAELHFLPLLWSACPWHTHAPGRPRTNRTPTTVEADLGATYWQALTELFRIDTIVAVGNVAHRSLLRSGVHAPKVRHPAHGGRSGFKQGLQELLLTGPGGN
jgi:uracil-DNA glycosylase